MSLSVHVIFFCLASMAAFLLEVRQLRITSRVHIFASSSLHDQTLYLALLADESGWIRFPLASFNWSARQQPSFPSISFSTKANFLHWLLGRFFWTRTTSPILTELSFVVKGPLSGWRRNYPSRQKRCHEWFIVLNSPWKFLLSGPWG